ncbi:MAG TPA: hypothetical protein VMH83_05360 [Candidatus Acidoferrum sp.]|nr:hypothetical protein [Candidatus Acidoferrum sp.]
MKPVSSSRFAATLLLLAGCGMSHFANALPSYARQTGQPCESCHVGGFGPQLTPFGQSFKLGGYTLGGGASDFDLPLSGMAVITHETTDADLPGDAGPHDGPNNNTNLQEASLFVAGRLTDHVGTFSQITYSDIDRRLALDNVDVRYSNTGSLLDKSLSWGVSFNNNPTLQDPWNTLPAWRYPYTASELAPAPGAATLINGGLEHQVLGASLYGMWDNHFYAELGGYRSLSASLLNKLEVDDEAGRISGAAPYWRLAYTDTIDGHNFMIGTFGLKAALHPGRNPGDTDTYTDTGLDAAWQYAATPEHYFTANASYVREHQQLDYSFEQGLAAGNSLHLGEFNLNASWHFRNTYGMTVGYFNTHGTGDALLYAPDPLDGSRVGSPDSSGYIAQFDWTPFGKRNSWGSPWANLRLGAQYVTYTDFNGASTNYDGSGRDAHDNNTLYFFAWFAF